MSEIAVHTERLQLTPLTADAVEALLDGDAARLRSLTRAEFASPAGPPPYMAESLPVVQERLRKNPAEAQWWNWLVVRQDNAEAVGSVAFGGMPDPAGSVLIGYAMYPSREGSGYATEAVRAMVEWAFTQPGVKIVRALAPVWNTPAVHVAEKVGMRPVGSYEDDEVGEVLIYETIRG
ncbi:MAG TPA: GNAT family N-acetyltransferase [Gemmatimonadales bacterium]|jgi:ribosomal-protein-alanine N-acetyltransferase